MGNMGYVQFRNTLEDLKDCQRTLDDGDIEDMSSDEKASMASLIELCAEIAQDHGDVVGGTDEDDIDFFPDSVDEAKAISDTSAVDKVLNLLGTDAVEVGADVVQGIAATLSSWKEYLSKKKKKPSKDDLKKKKETDDYVSKLSKTVEDPFETFRKSRTQESVEEIAGRIMSGEDVSAIVDSLIEDKGDNYYGNAADDDDYEEEMDRVEKIEKAQELMLRAISLVEEAVDGLDLEDNVESYWIDHAKIMVSGDHGFLTDDLNLDKIRGMVEEA